MKLIASRVWLSRILFLSASIYFPGCSISQPAPSLQKQTWIALEVDYCVSEHGEVTNRTWKTADPGVLDKLRAAYKMTSWAPLTVGGYTKYNEVRIYHANAPVSLLYIYNTEAGRFREYIKPLNDLKLRHDTPFRSYSIRWDSNFYNLLKAEIEATEKRPISFFSFLR